MKTERNVMKIEEILAERLERFSRNTLMSDEFLDFVSQNTQPMETLMAYYRCAIREVQTKFEVLNEELSVQYDRNPIESIKSRTKSLDSLIRKIRRKNLPMALDSIEANIKDVAGVRVICSFTDDIYMLAESFLRQDDIFLIEKKDYIKQPKENGYRSLHLIVEVPIFLKDETRRMKVEVQLRTIAMDFWASLEHKLRYKKNIPNEYTEELARELKACAEESARLDARMQQVKNRLRDYEEPEQDGKSPFLLPLPMFLGMSE